MARAKIKSGVVAAEQAIEFLQGDTQSEIKPDAEPEVGVERAAVEISGDVLGPAVASIDEFLFDAPVTGPAWGSVITTITSIDVAETFRRLEEELNVVSPSDPGVEFVTIATALQGADRNFLEAAKLERAAKLEEQRIDREVESRLETLRTKASSELEAEKAAGARSKAPTIQDIKDRVMSNWPTLQSQLSRQSEEIHAARAVCEQLTLAWRSRAATLRSLVERYAPNRLGA